MTLRIITTVLVVLTLSACASPAHAPTAETLEERPAATLAAPPTPVTVPASIAFADALVLPSDAPPAITALVLEDPDWSLVHSYSDAPLAQRFMHEPTGCDLELNSAPVDTIVIGSADDRENSLRVIEAFYGTTDLGIVPGVKLLSGKGAGTVDALVVSATGLKGTTQVIVARGFGATGYGVSAIFTCPDSNGTYSQFDVWIKPLVSVDFVRLP